MTETNQNRALGRIKHLLSSRDLTLGILIEILKKARFIKTMLADRDSRVVLMEALRWARVCSAFQQPSTRTRASSSVSAAGLGAYVFEEVGSKEGEEWKFIYSSAMKGASFLDEMITLACYFDMIILRTPHVGMPRAIAETLDKMGFNVSVINAGDGKGDGEHPVQALIDIDTFLEGFGLDIEKDWQKLPNYSIAFINDPRYSRVVRSDALLMGKSLKMELKFISCPELEPSRELLDELERAGVKFSVHNELQPASAVYVVRIPEDWLGKERAENFLKSGKCFSITKRVADKYGYKVVLHPYPRSENGGELPSRETNKDSLDGDKRALYIRQIQNGVPIRMATALTLLDPTLDLKRLKEQRLKRGFISQCVNCLRLEHADVGWSEKPYFAKLETLPKIFCDQCRPR